MVTSWERWQFLISGVLWVTLQPKSLTSGRHHIVEHWNKTNSRASVPITLLIVLVATIQEMELENVQKKKKKRNLND